MPWEEIIRANDVEKGRVFTQGLKKITPDSIDLKKVLRVYVLRGTCDAASPAQRRVRVASGGADKTSISSSCCPA